MSWESEARNWIAWARAPGHDAYWYYPGLVLEAGGRFCICVTHPFFDAGESEFS
jgi:hypothetical protein